MTPDCDVTALVLEETIEEARLVEAASCDIPVLPDVARAFLDGPTPGGWGAEIRIVAPAPMWVTIDGVHVDPGPLMRWENTLDVSPGRHLLQVGYVGDARASSAALFDAEEGEEVVWTVLPQLDGLEPVRCEEDWAITTDLGTTDLGRSSRRWVTERSGVACLQRAPLDFERLREHAQVAARTGWEELADASVARAAEADLERWGRWQRGHLRGAGWMRLAELAGLGGYVFVESIASGPKDGDGAGEEWGARLAAAGFLAATGARRSLIVQAGQPTSRAPVLLGSLGLATAILRPSRSEEFFAVGGGGRWIAIGLGLTQVVVNEVAQQRARKRRRARERAEEAKED